MMKAGAFIVQHGLRAFPCAPARLLVLKTNAEFKRLGHPYRLSTRLRRVYLKQKAA